MKLKMTLQGEQELLSDIYSRYNLVETEPVDVDESLNSRVWVAAMEEELMMLGAELGEGSLDRADALVWAVTDLLIDRPGERGPRIRQL